MTGRRSFKVKEGVNESDVHDVSTKQFKDYIPLWKDLSPEKTKILDKFFMCLPAVPLGFFVFTYLILEEIFGLKLYNVLGMDVEMFYLFIWAPFASLFSVTCLYLIANMNVSIFKKTIVEPQGAMLLGLGITFIFLYIWMPCLATDTTEGVCGDRPAKYAAMTGFIVPAMILLANIDAAPIKMKPLLFWSSLFTGMFTMMVMPELFGTSNLLMPTPKWLQGQCGGNAPGDIIMPPNNMGTNLFPSNKECFNKQHYKFYQDKLDTIYCGNEVCKDVCPKLWKDVKKSQECFVCECRNQTICNYENYYYIWGNLNIVSIKQITVTLLYAFLFRLWLITLLNYIYGTQYTYTLRGPRLINTMYLEGEENANKIDIVNFEDSDRKGSKESPPNQNSDNNSTATPNSDDRKMNNP